MKREIFYLFLIVGLAAGAAFGTIYDVTMFGAVCDGVTDDRAAIQAALDAASAAGNGTVTLPTGVCVVGGGLVVDGDIWLSGVSRDESVLKLAPGGYTGIVAVLDFSNVTAGGARDLTVDASWFGVTGASVFGVKVTGSQNVTMERTAILYRLGAPSGAPVTVDGVTLVDSFVAYVSHPTLSLLLSEPSTPTVYNDPSPTIEIDAPGVDFGVVSTTLVVDVDGIAVSASCVADGSSAACESPTLSTGPHTVTAQVTDSALRQATISRSFDLVLDTTPPTVTVIQPTATVEWGLAPTAILSYIDDVSGVDLSTLEVRANGHPTPVTCDAGTASATCQGLPSISLGANNMDITVRDRAGNVATVSYPFTVEDTVPPTVSFLEPLGPAKHELPPTIRIEMSDTGVGIDINAFVLEMDGVDVTDTNCVTYPTIKCTGDWGVGVHTALARSFDHAGNQSVATTTFEIIAETAPPIVDVQFLGGSPPRIRATYSDQGDVGSGVALDFDTFVAIVDGQDISSTCSKYSSYAYCYPPSLAPGRHTATVSISDDNGNVGTDTLTFDTVAQGAPSISINLAPYVTKLYNEPTPRFFVNYNDSNGIDLQTLLIEVDGTDITDTDCYVTGSWARCESTLTAGTRTVSAQIEDLNGNLGSTVWVFDLIIDTTPPTLTLVEPGAVVENKDPVILATYSDAGSGINKSTLSAKITQPFSLYLYCTLVGLTEGVCERTAQYNSGFYTVEVWIEDEAENEALVSHTFELVDSVAPSVEITEPTSPRIDWDLSPRIQIETDDAQATLQLTVDGVDQTSTCNAGLSCEAEWGIGSHTAVATLTDGDVNIGSASRDFEVVFETVPPEIEITPADGSVITDEVPRTFVVSYAERGEVSAAGIGLDLGTLVIKLDGVDITWRCNVAAGEAVCLSPDMAVGLHTIEARVSDLNGNEAVEESTFELAIQEAKIEILKPGDHASSFDPEIFVAYSEPIAGIDPATLDVAVDGVLVTSTCALEPGYAICQAPTLTPGTHSIAAQVQDGLGNLVTTEKDVEILEVDLRAVAKCNPTGGPAPLEVLFDGEAISPGWPIMQYRWDFDADGADEVTQWVYPLAVEHTYQTLGIQLATLEVVSYLGPTVIDICPVGVQGNPPTAEASASPSNGPVPLSVDFSCEGEDPEGPIAFYEWDLEGDGIFETLSATTGAATHVYQTPGEFAAVCRVTDYEGITALAPTEETTVRPGVAGSPTVNAYTSSSNTEGQTPFRVGFRGTASDEDGYITLWEWDFESDGTVDHSSSYSGSKTYTYTTPGVYAATLTVTDNAGLTASDTLRLVAHPSPTTIYVEDDTIDLASGESSTVKTTLGLDTPVKIVMRDEAGAVRRNLVDEFRFKGTYYDSWDGADDAGQPVAHGPYFAELEYQVGSETLIAEVASPPWPGPDESWERGSLPSIFEPFANDPLEIDFTLNNAAEATALIGLSASGEGFLLLLNSEALGAGDHRVIWDGLDTDGNLAVPPLGESFLVGMSADYFPNNTIFVAAAPVLSNVTVSPNLFDPSTPDYLTPQDPVAEITYSLDRLADVELTVTNLETGVVLRQIVDPLVVAGTDLTITWDGRAADGRFADRGDYRLTLRAVDSAGSASLTRLALVRVFY